jgi:superfamily I DNA/RNA helicase
MAGAAPTSPSSAVSDPDAVDIRLEENFRSTGHILDAPMRSSPRKAKLGKRLWCK